MNGLREAYIKKLEEKLNRRIKGLKEKHFLSRVNFQFYSVAFMGSVVIMGFIMHPPKVLTWQSVIIDLLLRVLIIQLLSNFFAWLYEVGHE